MQLHRNYHSGKNSPRRNKKEASSCPVPYRQLSQPGIHGLPEVYLLGLGVKGASVPDLWGLKGQALHSPLGTSAPSKCGQTARLARWAMPQDSRHVVRAAEIRPGSCPPAQPAPRQLIKKKKEKQASQQVKEGRVLDDRWAFSCSRGFFPIGKKGLISHF